MATENMFRFISIRAPQAPVERLPGRALPLRFDPADVAGGIFRRTALAMTARELR
jgi:hypothetical protein